MLKFFKTKDKTEETTLTHQYYYTPVLDGGVKWYKVTKTYPPFYFEVLDYYKTLEEAKECIRVLEEEESYVPI